MKILKNVHNNSITHLGYLLFSTTLRSSRYPIVLLHFIILYKRNEPSIDGPFLSDGSRLIISCSNRLGIHHREIYVGSLLWLLSTLYLASSPFVIQVVLQRLLLPYECGTSAFFILSVLARIALSMRSRSASTHSSKST